MKPSEILRNYGWTRYKFARDEYGNNINHNSELAKCFCISGAIRRSCNGKKEEERLVVVIKVRDKLVEKYGCSTIVDFNDGICKSAEEAIGLLEECGE